jgi:hypothetical protein
LSTQDIGIDIIKEHPFNNGTGYKPPAVPSNFVAASIYIIRSPRYPRTPDQLAQEF